MRRIHIVRQCQNSCDGLTNLLSLYRAYDVDGGVIATSLRRVSQLDEPKDDPYHDGQRRSEIEQRV